MRWMNSNYGLKGRLKMNLKKLLDDANHYAIIGMHPDKEKYAHRINALLLKRGKKTYGVNKNYTEIDGNTIYPSISDVPETIDMAVMVVNPTIGITLIESIAKKGVKTLWLQPGTRSDEIKELAKSLGLEVVEDCVLVQYEESKE